MTGQGVLAQRGLKATLQAFSAEVLYPIHSLRGDLRTSALCYSPWQDFVAVAELLTFYRSCQMRLDQFPFVSYFKYHSFASDRKFIQQ